jgi:pantothenate synthetase
MIAEIEVDYLVVVDPETFLPPEDFKRDVLLAGAVRIGNTRLIDNLRLS